jgi:hypothetical protein
VGRAGAVAALGTLLAGLLGSAPALAGPSASTLTVTPTIFTLPATAAGNRATTFTFTFTSGNDSSGGASLAIPYPTGFSAPLLANQSAAPGVGCATASIASVAKQKVNVNFACSAHGTFTVTSVNETVAKKAAIYQVAASTTAAPITVVPTVTVLPGPATHLSVQGVPAATDSDVALGPVTVTAKDPFGNTVPSFAGTVRFGTTDVGASIPGPYTFVPATDNGAHQFTGVWFHMPATQTFSAGCPGCNPLAWGSAKTTVNAPSSISMTPGGASIPVGDTAQFAATGTYPDGLHDISSFVQWAGDNAGVATLSGTGLAAASHPGSVNVSATLVGVTGSTALTVTQAATTTASSEGATAYGTAGVIDVTVSADAPGIGTPTGTITITDASSDVVGSGTLSGGSVHVTLSDNLPAGSDSLTVSYNGSTDFGASSGGVSETVNPFTPTVSVTPDQASVSAGTGVHLTVSVSSACGDCAAPSGNVDDLVLTGQSTSTVIHLGSRALSAGQTAYAWDTTGVTADTYNCVAAYHGDTNYNAGDNTGSPAAVTVG